jgi:hypothetical protein
MVSTEKMHVGNFLLRKNASKTGDAQACKHAPKKNLFTTKCTMNVLCVQGTYEHLTFFLLHNSIFVLMKCRKMRLGYTYL